MDEILAAPDGRIVSLLWQRGQGRDSGLPMEMEWQIASFRDGRVTRVARNEDRDEALADAGLKADAAG